MVSVSGQCSETRSASACNSSSDLDSGSPETKGSKTITRLTSGAAKADEPCGCGEWAEPKSFHWQLSDVRALPRPLMTHGQPGLWTPGPELAVALAEVLNGQPVSAGRS